MNKNTETASGFTVGPAVLFVTPFILSIPSIFSKDEEELLLELLVIQ